MITSITLENYKSFGESQTIPLEPITVIVGPNNCGKSSFLGLGKFIQSVIKDGSKAAFAKEGGENFVFHRPRNKQNSLLGIAWHSEIGHYAASIKSDIAQVGDEIIHHKNGPLYGTIEPQTSVISGLDIALSTIDTMPFSSLLSLGNDMRISIPDEFTHRLIHSEKRTEDYLPIIAPITQSRFVKLSLDALRKDAEVVPEPQLGEDGSGLAAVLGLWRGSMPERSDALDDFLRSALPEVKRALVRPAPQRSYQRLWIEQRDGELFDAPHLSDGILFFTALAMHALDVPEGAILFIEEPELCVHPRRLQSLMDFFRRLTQERKCQLVITTHSPILLDAFRDEPESIVLFQRGPQGTRVKRLTDIPDLANNLYKSEPGSLLANGFFNEPF